MLWILWNWPTGQAGWHDGPLLAVSAVPVDSGSVLTGMHSVNASNAETMSPGDPLVFQVHEHLQVSWISRDNLTERSAAYSASRRELDERFIRQALADMQPRRAG